MTGIGGRQLRRGGRQGGLGPGAGRQGVGLRLLDTFLGGHLLLLVGGREREGEEGRREGEERGEERTRKTQGGGGGATIASDWLQQAATLAPRPCVCPLSLILLSYSFSPGLVRTRAHLTSSPNKPPHASPASGSGGTFRLQPCAQHRQQMLRSELQQAWCGHVSSSTHVEILAEHVSVFLRTRALPPIQICLPRGREQLPPSHSLIHLALPPFFALDIRPYSARLTVSC